MAQPRLVEPKAVAVAAPARDGTISPTGLEDEGEEASLQREIDHLVKTLLTRERLSIAELRDNLIVYFQRPITKAVANEPTPPFGSEADSGL